MGGPVERVVIEADGGSRGNPGPAAYGALVKDADTGRVLAEEGTSIGVASNNVAEYHGLIAGLRMAQEVAPGAEIEVRMDSKLVVEQMSGRWKIKHPDMKPLALEANRLAPRGTTYTWVPRELNKHADRLANEALDGLRSGVTRHPDPDDDADSLVEELQRPEHDVGQETAGFRGWSPPAGPVTTLVLVRH
ncbi:MAG: reverse transcriptase-like protein, partial [Nocardioides sp.]